VFKLTIDTTNDAFNEDRGMGPEVARILRTLADEVERYRLDLPKPGHRCTNGRLHDLKGNHVGDWQARV